MMKEEVEGGNGREVEEEEKRRRGEIEKQGERRQENRCRFGRETLFKNKYVYHTDQENQEEREETKKRRRLRRTIRREEEGEEEKMAQMIKK